MKKIIAIAALFMAGFSTAFAADSSWGKLSLFDTAALPDVKTVKGIELGLVYSNTPDLTGFQFTFLYGRTENLTGIQMAFVANAKKASGIQLGAANMTSEMTGAQLAFINYAETFTGFQLGLVNYVKTMQSGLQIGFVNIITNSKLPAMVIANAKF